MTTAQEILVPEAKLETIAINLYGFGDREVQIHQVEKRLQEQQQTIDRLHKDIKEIKETVRTALHKFDKKSDTLELDLDEVNEILQDIGADKILFTYTATVTYTVTINGIEADSQDEAERKALNAVDCRVDTDNCGEDAEVYNEEYEASDVEEEDN
jgi:uncharacterized protein (UPF0147 family)